MAQKIEVVTAESAAALVTAVNEYMAEQGKGDSRMVIELAGGVTCGHEGIWVATVMTIAAHKRSFEDGEG